MIISFSIPETTKYAPIIEWYQSIDKNDRSREFREIFLSYLKKPQHTMNKQVEHHVSQESLKVVELDRINIVGVSMDDDLDSRLNMLGVSE